MHGPDDRGGGDFCSKRIIKGVAVAAETIADNEDKFTSGLNWTRRTVVSVGFWLKLLVVTPCYVVFALVFIFLVVVAYASAFYLSATGADPEAVSQCFSVFWNRL